MLKFKVDLSSPRLHQAEFLTAGGPSICSAIVEFQVAVVQLSVHPIKGKSPLNTAPWWPSKHYKASSENAARIL